MNEIKDANLALSQYEIKSGAIQYKMATWIGFSGKCRFLILTNDEFWVRLCNLLADFSFYSGTGYKPTFGLGQTKLLYEMDRKNP